MKIISKFHDYYDSARAFGEDPNIIYYRKEIYIEETPNHKLFEMDKYRRNFFYMEIDDNEWTTDNAFISFCGETYPVILVSNIREYTKTPYYTAIYNPEDLKKYPSLYKEFTREKKLRWYVDAEYDSIKNFMTNFKKDTLGLDIFFKYNVPYFITMKKRTILNPQLKNYFFQKIYDPYSAYQKIAGFVGGVLSRCEVPEPIEDKYLIKQKGFNERSFRKEKHQRKNKKKH